MNRQSSSPLDDLLRQRLGEAPVPPPPAGGWDALRERLDTDPDLQLRAKLSSLAPPAAPAGWKDLERRLDPHASADSRLAERLNDLQPATPPAAWAAFEAARDARTGEAVDAVVLEKIAADVAGPSSGWSALAARLELIRERRHRVVAGFITEIALLASLLLLFLRFGPAPAAPAFPLATVSTAPTGVGTADQSSSTAPGFAPAGVNIAPTDLETADHSSPGSPAATLTPAAAPRPAASSTATSTAGVLPAEASTAAPIPNAPSASMTVRNAPTVTAGIAQPASTTPASPDRGSAANDTAPIRASRAVATLAVPAPTAVTNPAATEDRATDELATALTPVSFDPRLPSPPLRLPPAVRDPAEKQRPAVYLSVFASPLDVNQVVTPEQAILDLDVIADNRLVRGESFGALLEFEQGNSAVHLGMTMNRMSYIPTALKWFAQDDFPLVEPVEGYSRFLYEHVNFPFAYSHVLAENDRWRWSASVNVQASIVTKSAFFVPDGDQQAIIDDINNRALREAQLAAQAGYLENNSRSPESLNPRMLTNPPAGWWEGGEFFENATFHAGGGMRLERILSRRTSVFFAPSFSRAIYFGVEGGVGPYRDRIHLMQLRFGGRFKL